MAGKWNENDSEIMKALSESTTRPVTFLAKYKSKGKLLILNSYQYLGEKESKNVKHIKSLLDNGVKAIPISYELYVPAWKKFQATKYTTITPDVGYGILMKNGTTVKYSDIKKLHSDIHTKINSKQFTLKRTVIVTKDYNPYAGHVVTIVGYDSEGFIIKNSWGTDWRYYGYERISYDYHELFAYETLVLKKVSFKK